MIERKPRIVGALVGDIEREPSARTKYGYLFEAVRRRFPLAGVYDATLRGPRRLINILLSIHPNRRVWRQRSYKHPAGFRLRSRLAASHLESLRGKADLALQVGVLFDARWNNVPLPSVIYTDYTAQLSAQRPDAGRSPFTPAERAAWIELERQAFERAAHICTRGQLVRDSVLNDYGIPPERVTAIGGGVNFAELPSINEPATSEAPTALFIGKEFYRKGGDLLLTAFSQVRAAIPQAQLRLLTGDDIPPGLPLEGVEIIRPTWDREAIAALYRRADLFVLPSRLETWGDVLLEAMAYGLPCIGVIGQAMQEIIKDGQTGLIVPPEDPGALASAMTRLLGDASLRGQWGRAARHKLESEYTWDRVVDRLSPVIEAAHLISNR
ncbi:MAG: glycosyltransferase family 4 protein [Chloroflexi bacterium]|nr:glycosyltransferase family 4 protein [Chloroflexota bacterium]